MKPARATQEPWMSGGDVIDSRDIVSVVGRAHREERRERMFALWAFAFAAILTGIVVLLSGCARPLDTAIVSANAARDVGDAAADALDAGCTQRYAAARASDVPEIDRACLPAAKAYSAYRAAHAALVAGIQAAEGGALTTGEVLVLAARLAATERALAAALGAIR